MIYVFLANGFEEIEALTPVDVLRRAGLTVQTVGIGANVRISTLTVKRATTFVVSGTNNEVF